MSVDQETLALQLERLRDQWRADAAKLRRLGATHGDTSDAAAEDEAHADELEKLLAASRVPDPQTKDDAVSRVGLPPKSDRLDLPRQTADGDAPMQGKESIAWLVALGSPSPQWWTGRGDDWTAEIDGTARNPAHTAIRFARREDAERAIGWLLDKTLARGCKAEEHLWLG